MSNKPAIATSYRLKFINIISAIHGLYALDEDGQVWEYGPIDHAGADTIANPHMKPTMRWHLIPSPELEITKLKRKRLA